ncbi:hypothetical protein E1301_Tti008078 [Triplophysa tibetana]|uniref:Protein FAM228B n=1 Tax=Triplophysa tibetana TaxID=1572043 RepID=A0A5A9NH24_9TELE|nr:hypothetical protein E1301_Tti008078 [Triplophysa tibetana]
MTHTKINDDMQYTFSVRSKKQLMEQFHSEQKEAYAITQPLLDTEAGFIKNLEDYLNHRDTLALKKRELLHKRWTECVWLPVQRSIAQHFTLHGYNQTKNMRSMHTHYINYSNAKAVYIIIGGWMNVVRVYLFLSIVLQSHMPNPPETLCQNDFGETTVVRDQGMGITVNLSLCQETRSSMCVYGRRTVLSASVLVFSKSITSSSSSANVQCYF